ncbi:MAG: peptide ABC transporter substrate-binding protein [Chloroflexota bacterium]|nr:MAG: peptide ABC transporter substrate-binding protein [Chloroflexota bacterium]
MVHIRWQALIAVLGIIFLGTLLAYFAFGLSTVAQADYGGTYIEAIAGTPNIVNPLFNQSNSVDRDLSALIFNGLTRADERGVIKPDLARSWEISPDGLVYTFTLRSDVTWSDGAPFSSADVLYTIQTIQSSDYPGLSDIAALWRTVAVTAINPLTVRMQLSQPYAPFLDYTTIGLLPSHLLQDVGAADLPTAQFSHQPIGTGPFVLEELTSEGATLTPNPRYFGQRPYLGTLQFKFYQDGIEAALAAYERGDVEGVSQITPELLTQARGLEKMDLQSAQIAGMTLVFFNNSKPQFQDKQVRQALLYGMDRQKIIDTILQGQGLIGAGPILPNSWAYDEALKKYPYDPQRANQILDQAGWQDKNNDGVRERGEQQLAFTLLTNTDDPTRARIAQQLADDWSKIGVKVDVELVPAPSLVQEHLRPRQFDAVLSAIADLPADPDPYNFWHSTQTPDKADAGQNYSGWENADADDLLQQARRTIDLAARADLYRQFQMLFMEDVPAAVLYYPVYTYGIDERLHGVQLAPLLDPSDRFRNISQWYINTRRVILSESQVRAAPTPLP